MHRNFKVSKIPSNSLRRKMIRFKLCVVRHGETPENKNNIFQGHLDSVLSEEGIRQSEHAGERLKDEKFTHVFASDLKRAYTTAENILKRNRHQDGLVMIKDPRIREKAYGIWEGKTKDHVMEEIRRLNSTPLECVPEGGESLPQLTERAVEFFDELCKKIHTEATIKTPPCHEGFRDGDDSKYVLVVSHGGTIRQLFSYFVRNIATEFQGASKKNVGKICPNTGVSKFDVFVGRESEKAEFLKCTMLYDASHLIVDDDKRIHSSEDKAL